MSGLGILAMVFRIRQNPETPRSQFEWTALRVTGFGFVDSIGALGLMYFSYNEGKESFKKAAGTEG